MGRGGFKAFSDETAAEIKALWRAREEVRGVLEKFPKRRLELLEKLGLKELPTKASIARRYGVSPPVIQHLVEGRTYKDCEYKARLAEWIYATEE